jgi:hypothetical protein
VSRVDTGPPRRPGRLDSNPDPLNRVQSPSSHKPARWARAYELRVRHRFLRGLCQPFRCSQCGEVAFDPLGRNGKQEFLCGRCSE